MPQDWAIAKKISDLVVTALYNTVPHPPATFIGTNATASGVFTKGTPAPAAPGGTSLYAFRSADGSSNNPLVPGLGQSGLPYARSVQNQHPLAPHLLPDTGLVFDALLKARDVRVISVVLLDEKLTI